MDARQCGERLALLHALNLQPYKSTGTRDTLVKVVLTYIEMGESHRVRLAGRVTALRSHGRILFADLRDESGTIQLILKETDMPADFSHLKKWLSWGDVIEVAGVTTVSKAGQPSIAVQEVVLLSPCLEHMPQHGKDHPNLRFANRSADLIVNAQARQNLHARALTLASLRQTLTEYGFMEHTTPVLQPKRGGGKAKTFNTQCHALHQQMHLRVTMELYLKRLIAGGFERVYEMAKCFRNESASAEYSPEFMMLEAYGAYMSLDDMVDMVKMMVANVSRCLAERLGFPDVLADGVWQTVTYKGGCKQFLGIDVTEFSDIDGIKRQLAAIGQPLDHITDLPTLHDKIAENLLPLHFTGPTLLTQLPTVMTPLMRTLRDDPATLDRAWVFINGILFCDIGGELTDPDEQVRRLSEQLGYLAGKREDNLNLDSRHISSLRLGLPPLVGIGFGVDRFLLALLGESHIREVIPFPLAYEKM